MPRPDGPWLVLALATALASGTAVAQRYPSKPVRIVVPYPAGGPSDYAGRVAAQKLTEYLGQQVIVDNRPGGSGMVATEQVARSAPDGYTLMIANGGTFSILPHLVPKAAYDPVRDFAPVANLIGGPCYLLVHPSVPARNVRELVALAKGRPGQLSLGSGGVGQITHMAGELLKVSAGIEILHVPYKGMAQVVPELIGGQISMIFSTAIETLQFARAGRVRALAVTSKARIAAAPDIPTIAESGLPGFEALTWNGIVAPAALPRELVQSLNRDLLRALASPELKERLGVQGNYAIGGTPEEFGTYIRTELAKWGKVVKQANIRME
jgi:tripartite-type tricarboxylate transporter receptor subunit TctC